MSRFFLNIKLFLKLGNVSSTAHVTHLRRRWFQLRNRCHLVLFLWEITYFILIFTFITSFCDDGIFLILCTGIINNFTNSLNIILIKFFDCLVDFHLLRIWFLALCNWFYSGNLRSSTDLWFWNIILRHGFIKPLHVMSWKSTFGLWTNLGWRIVSTSIWADLVLASGLWSLFKIVSSISRVKDLTFWCVSIIASFFIEAIFTFLRSSTHCFWNSGWSSFLNS